MSFKQEVGRWSITFDEAQSKLGWIQKDSGVRLEGCLSMKVGDKDWQIKEPMDAVGGRLALTAPDNSVQGYLTFAGHDGHLEVRAIHRTAQFYSGTLAFAGTVVMPGAFACRVAAPEQIHVVQLGTGAADSASNDALFDRENDRCLAFSGAKDISLKTNADGTFALSFELAIQKAAQAALVVDLTEHYYRDRYVPYYQPIDRKRCPSPPTGWMSWNVYFDQAGAAENLAEARIGAKELKPFGMEYWSIESWQGNSDKLPVSSFDNLSLKAHATQFPEGMARLAEDIRSVGFKPGIWTAPFGTGSKEFYEAHKDWFLHDQDGNPMHTWNGFYTIDPSNDEVVDYLRDIHRKMAQEWGYEFFKIDGMSGRGPGYCAHFYERPEVRARFKNPDCPNPFERCVQAFRDGIGPGRVLLACQGHYTGPEAGLGDASRIGGDIVAPNTTSNWGNIMSQARATLNQMFVHNIVFFMDPDTMLVGDYHTLEEARVTATVVALPGQMMFSGDKLAGLAPERMRLLQQALPVCDVHPMNLYPVFDMAPVWDLKVSRPFGDWDVVALFNWDEQEKEIGFTFKELGLDPDKFYAIYEFWTDSFQDIYENEFSMVVPGHACRLLAIHEERPYPQFLSSDRHMTQGAVDVENVVWDSKKKELVGEVKLVGGHPTTLSFLLPDTYTLQKVSAKDADMALKVDRDGILRVTLTAPKSQTAEFHVKVEAK